MFGNLSRSALTAVSIASDESARLGYYYLGVEHLVMGLCKMEDARLHKLLTSGGIEPAEWMRLLVSALPSPVEPAWGKQMITTPRVQQVVRIAGRIAKEFHSDRADALHLAAAVLVEGDGLPVRLLVKAGRDPEQLRAALWTGMQNARPAAAQNPQDQETPALSQYGRDLCFEARQGNVSPMIGRQAELKQLVQILLRRTKNNPLVIGEAGVGKSCLVYGLAQYLCSADVLDVLKGRRVIELNLASVVAGTRYRGDFEERLDHIVKEARDHPEVILFIDEIHTVLGAGSASGSLDAANILKPALANGGLRCIGATTNAEYRRYIQSDAALERRFEPVQVSEPTAQQTEEILAGLRPSFESHHHVKITDEAIAMAVRLAARYLTERQFPDKAIDLVDTACAQAQLGTIHQSSAAAAGEKVLTAADVAAVISAKLDYAVPEGELSQSDAERALHLEEKLRARVLGQDEAVATVARVMRSHMAGMSDQGRPIAVFLFVGPTGVGKTELARALAANWFGSEKKLLRFDMSEYGEAHTVSRLLGAPPSYVGHEEEGQLARAVRSNPYAVLLLDEVEKAHPDVLKIFLQVFDAGRLTDSHGRLLNFTNTVIVMTSNLGVAVRDQNLGFLGSADNDRSREAQAGDVREAVRHAFTPEFRNRIDAEVVFHPLADDAVLRGILTLQIAEVAATLREKQIRLTVGDSVYQALLREGYNRKFGARDLRRTVHRVIRDPLADGMLSGRFRSGQTVKAEAGADGRIVFETVREEFK